MTVVLRVLVWSGVLLVAAISGMARASTEAWLSGAEIERQLAGSTIEGRYDTGRGFREAYGFDGRLAYAEEGTSEIFGTWSIVSNAFCTFYDTDLNGGCFRVTQPSDNCFHFHFAASTTEEAHWSDYAAPMWTAQAWLVDRPPTCDEKPMS
ncbi:MAG: hypothetical protein ACFCUN_11145 [Hyphomicrobiaceae bacterium]